jgi:hypothetical protein
MTAGDIFLKLLPFTHSTNGITKGAFLTLDLGDIIITTITLMLWLLFFYFLIKLWKSKKQDEDKINYLLTTLEKYKSSIQTNYNDLLEDLKEYTPKNKNRKENDLYLLWNEFHESLIKVENRITGKIEYRNSIDAEYFFNKQTLLTHIGTKLYAAIPPILLGLGLIGTFLGLFVGLVQLNMDDSNTLKESMRLLIHAAGVKFAASIWGLGLSLVFTVSEKLWENELEDKIEQIQALINETFERRTAEQSLEEISVNSVEQKLALNGLAATLTEKLATELNATLIPRLDTIGAGFGSMGQDIANAIAQSLEAPLAQIAQTVEFASKDQGAQSTQLLETIVERFISKIDEKAGEQSQVFQQNIESTQILMGQVAQNLTDFMRLSQETFTEQNRINSERDRLIVANLESIRQSQNETIDKLVHSVAENIQSLTSNVTNSVNQIGEVVRSSTSDFVNNASNREQELNDSVSMIVQRIDTTTEKMASDSARRDEAINATLIRTQEVFSNAMRVMQEGSNDAIGQIAMQLNESIASIKHEMDQIFKNITAHASSVDAIISQSAQRLSKVPQYLEVLDSSALKLQSFAAKTEESSKQLTQASGDLVKFNDSVGKYTAEMDATGSMFKQTAEMTERIAKGSQDTYSLLAEQYNDLLDQNESSMVKFQEQVDAYKRQLEAGVQHTFTQFDKQLSDFASGLSASVAEINDAIVDLTETRGNK